MSIVERNGRVEIDGEEYHAMTAELDRLRTVVNGKRDAANGLFRILDLLRADSVDHAIDDIRKLRRDLADTRRRLDIEVDNASSLHVEVTALRRLL
jgi:hypothetical protein